MDIRDHYASAGWVHVPQAIDAATIDALATAYRCDLLSSRRKFYRQNTNRYERNRIDAHGHVLNSFLDPHDYRSMPAVREAVLAVLFDTGLHRALQAAVGDGPLRLMQSMLFDKNAETVPHQDWWYLDSVPNGHLAGAWIAIEDIPEAAGRFFLVDGSHRVVLHDDLRSLRHDRWLGVLKDYVAANPGLVVAPAMRKGDVIVWNSRTVHGALPTTDPRLSRKSLTGHFLPAGMKFGNLFVVKDWVEFTPYGGNAYFANQPEYSLLNDAKARVKTAVYNNPAMMRAARWIQTRLR